MCVCVCVHACVCVCVTGYLPIEHLVELQQFKLSLPQTAAVWTRILARLMEQKQFMAVAFLTVGFGEVQPPISWLDHTCPIEVDCSSGHVEEVCFFVAKSLGGIRDTCFLQHSGTFVFFSNQIIDCELVYCWATPERVC